MKTWYNVWLNIWLKRILALWSIQHCTITFCSNFHHLRVQNKKAPSRFRTATLPSYLFDEAFDKIILSCVVVKQLLLVDDWNVDRPLAPCLLGWVHDWWTWFFIQTQCITNNCGPEVTSDDMPILLILKVEPSLHCFLIVGCGLLLTLQDWLPFFFLAVSWWWRLTPTDRSPKTVYNRSVGVKIDFFFFALILISHLVSGCFLCGFCVAVECCYLFCENPLSQWLLDF
jgi:hypothetical protein